MKRILIGFSLLLFLSWGAGVYAFKTPFDDNGSPADHKSTTKSFSRINTFRGCGDSTNTAPTIGSFQSNNPDFGELTNGQYGFEDHGGGGTTTITFDVSDPETAPEDLLVTAQYSSITDGFDSNVDCSYTPELHLSTDGSGSYTLDVFRSESSVQYCEGTIEITASDGDLSTVVEILAGHLP